VKNLREYESRMQPLWKRKTNLLVAIVKPHKAVSSTARWLKPLQILSIDTSIFGARSFLVCSCISRDFNFRYPQSCRLEFGVDFSTSFDRAVLVTNTVI